MRVLLPAMLSLLAAAGAGAEAQTRDDLLRCRMIEEDSLRLACYDAIGISAASPRSKYEAIPLAELQENALGYRGRLVEVSGWIDPDERYFLLKGAEDEARSLPIDFENLTRAEQQTFRSTCGEGCEAIVQGRVGPVNFTTGIVAEALIAR
jgi:hypothetical protein